MRALGPLLGIFVVLSNRLAVAQTGEVSKRDFPFEYPAQSERATFGLRGSLAGLLSLTEIDGSYFGEPNFLVGWAGGVGGVGLRIGDHWATDAVVGMTQHTQGRLSVSATLLVEWTPVPSWSFSTGFGYQSIGEPNPAPGLTVTTKGVRVPLLVWFNIPKEDKPYGKLLRIGFEVAASPGEPDQRLGAAFSQSLLIGSVWQ